MAKYKKRKDGRYAAQFIIGHDENGKRKMKTIYGRTIVELENKIVEFKSLMQQGIIIDAKDYTLGSWAQEWLKTYGSKGLRLNTISNKQSLLKHITTSNLSNIPIAKVQTHHLQQLINDVYEKAPTRIVALYGIVNNMYDCAVKNNIVLRNIAKDVELPKVKLKKKRALTAEEQTAFRTADLLPQERLFSLLALDCGLRKGEILALSLSDFDDKKEIVRISKTYDHVEHKIQQRTKTDSGTREVPISSELITLAKKTANDIGSLQLFTRNNKIYETKIFDIFWENLLSKVIDKIGCEVAIDNIPTSKLTPHYLRHTYATNLFYAGIDIKAAQYLMGHSDIQTTLNIYTHLNLDNQNIKERLTTYIKNMSVSQKSVNN